MTADAIEHAIEDEEQTLAETATLLRSAVAWSRWPVAARRALALALDEGAAESETSAWQARILRHHLFGPDAWNSPLRAPSRPATIDIRRAERLRIDLPRLASLRAGAYLTTRRGP